MLGGAILTFTPYSLIFFIEGLASMVIAAAAWFLISDRPSACKWLTPEERELAEFRVMAENVGQHEAIDKMHSKAVKAGIWNANTLGESDVGHSRLQFDSD